MELPVALALVIVSAAMVLSWVLVSCIPDLRKQPIELSHLACVVAHIEQEKAVPLARTVRVALVVLASL
jgi:hypothetical protein